MMCMSCATFLNLVMKIQSQIAENLTLMHPIFFTNIENPSRDVFPYMPEKSFSSNVASKNTEHSDHFLVVFLDVWEFSRERKVAPPMDLNKAVKLP